MKKKPVQKPIPKISLEEYEAIKAKEAKRFKLKLPPSLKWILATPFLIIFCCGLFLIPFILYQIATSPAKSIDKEKEKTTHERLKTK